MKKTKDQMFEDIMSSVGKEVKKTLREISDVQPAQQGKLVVIINSNDSRIETYINNLKKPYISVERTNRISVYCQGEKEVWDVLESLRDLGIFSDKKYASAWVKIIRKDQIGINDSLNEKADDSIEGDFITDYVHHREDGLEYGEMESAKWHAKPLAKAGLVIDYKQGRYSVKYYIHYKGAKQYETLVKWVAFHFGYNDLASQTVNIKDRKRIEEIIKSGKRCTWDC